MLVKHWMSRNVITSKPNDSMQLATKLMRQHQIRSLPVLDHNRLVGIVSNGDLKRASASNATSLEIRELRFLLDKIKVKEIMTKSPIHVLPTQTVDEVAEAMLKKNISMTPVLDSDGILIGIITKSDILKVLVSLSGAHHRSLDFGFNVEDQPGTIKEITDTIRSFGGRLASILISYREAEVGFRHVYIRVFYVNRSELEALKDELFNSFDVLYILDHIEQIREIF